MINIHKIKTLFTATLFLGTVVQAQVGGSPASATTTDPAVKGGTADIVNDSWLPSLRRDGTVDRIEHNNYLTPWQPIREADVLYRKKVWREIDARQKQNLALRYPGDEETGGGMFIEILVNAIKKGDIVAFDDDRFTIPLTAESVMTRLTGKNDTIEVELPDGSFEKRITVRSFDPDAITKFRLKEEWIFDKNQGRMVVHILGMSPYFTKMNTDGSARGDIPLFWLYYPDMRPIMVKYEVYNPENDVYRMTWDDFFEKRMFSSFIIKSNINNPFQDEIKRNKSGIDALNEAEDIKEKLFNREHDMWVY